MARPACTAAVDIFERTQKAALVEQCLKAMTRKFRESPEVGAGQSGWDGVPGS